MRLSSRRGSVLVTNLIALTAFSLLAVVVSVAARYEVRQAKNYTNQAKAQAIAEAGLEDALHMLYSSPTWRTGFTNKSFGEGRYTVTLSSGSSPRITSSGVMPGFLTTTVKSVSGMATFVSTETTKYAIVASSMVINGTVDAYDPLINLQPSSGTAYSGTFIFANGTVDTTGTACSSPRILGDLSYRFNGTPFGPPQAACVSGVITQSTFTITIPVTACGTCKTVNNNSTGITPSSAYNSGAKKLSIGNGDFVTLTAGTYYFSQIVFTSSGTLRADTSSGPVKIFYDNKFQESTTCTFYNTSKIPSRLLIADLGSGSKVDLSCPGALHAYLEGETTHFDVNPGVEVYGHISAKLITIDAGGELHYDINSATSYNHVTWTMTSASSWSEGYKR